MDITPQLVAGSQRIDAYGDGGFTISGVRVEGSIIIFPGSRLSWDISAPETITIDSLSPLFGMSCEIVIIGCGKKHVLLPAALRQNLRQRGISMDSMDTGAACRTFNVLLSEGRAVAAALIAV